jgi:hypothetical protein
MIFQSLLLEDRDANCPGSEFDAARCVEALGVAIGSSAGCDRAVDPGEIAAPFSDPSTR